MKRLQHPSPGPRTSTPRPGLVLDVPDAQNLIVLVSTPGLDSNAATPRPLVSLVPNMDTSRQGTDMSMVPSQQLPVAAPTQQHTH